jgi:hypothetical protein
MIIHMYIHIGLIDTEGTTKALVSASALQLFCCARLLLYMRTSAYYQFCANERRVHAANAAAAHAHEPRGRAKTQDRERKRFSALLLLIKEQPNSRCVHNN